MTKNALRVPYFDVATVRNTRLNRNKMKGTINPAGSNDQIGTGAFGRVYVISPAAAKDLVEHLDGHLRGVWSLPRKGTKIVLKIMRAPNDDVRLWLTNALRELFIQHHLATAPAKMVHGKVFDAKKYVPTPYFGGYVRSTGEFIICMKLQPGVPVKNRLIRNKAQYLDIERAYIAMLLNNVLHVDYHDGNVMVTPDGGVHLVDFGGAVLLSDTFRGRTDLALFKKKLRAFLAHWPTRATFVSQARHVNQSRLDDFDVMMWVEDQLGIVSQSASSTLLDMRGRIEKANDARNLNARRATIHYPSRK